MRTTFSFAPSFKTLQMVAISCSVLSLVACKSNGTVQTSMGDRDNTIPTGPPVNTQSTPFTPVQEAVGEASDGLRAIPMLLNDLGGITDGLLGGVTQLADSGTASPSLMRSAAPASTALSPVLSEIGQGLDALVLTTENGLGQLGTSSDPIGTTISGTEGLLLHTGDALNNAGDTVKALGNRLGPLSAVTDVAGNAVGGVSQLVSQVGSLTGSVVTSTPVTELTSSLNQAAVPVLGTVLGGVQNVGSATGLAKPINNLLTTVGGLVTGIGTQAQSSGMPVIDPTGRLVSQVGNTVSALNGIAGADTASGSSGLLSNALLSGGLLNGGLLASNPVTGLLGGLLSPGASSPLSPVTGGLLIGGTSSPLAPVSGLLSSLTGGLGSLQTPLSGGATATQPLSNLLSPLTSLLKLPAK